MRCVVKDRDGQICGRIVQAGRGHGEHPHRECSNHLAQDLTAELMRLTELRKGHLLKLVQEKQFVEARDFLDFWNKNPICYPAQNTSVPQIQA